MIDMLANFNGGFGVIQELPIAYVGPGAGLTFLGALIAVILGVLLVIGGVLVWPFRALWRKIKGAKPAAENEEETSQNTQVSENSPEKTDD